MDNTSNVLFSCHSPLCAFVDTGAVCNDAVLAAVVCSNGWSGGGDCKGGGVVNDGLVSCFANAGGEERLNRFTLAGRGAALLLGRLGKHQ